MITSTQQSIDLDEVPVNGQRGNNSLDSQRESAEKCFCEYLIVCRLVFLRIPRTGWIASMSAMRWTLSRNDMVPWKESSRSWGRYTESGISAVLMCGFSLTQRTYTVGAHLESSEDPQGAWRRKLSSAGWETNGIGDATKILAEGHP